MAYNAPVIDEVELDREICREATGGVGGQTTIIVAGNAKEQRNVDWQMSRQDWNVLWVANAQDAKFRNLIRFFQARRWRGYGFRFYDWSDHDDWGGGKVLLDAATGKYRLYKEYSDAVRPFYRPIYKPIIGTMALSVPGATLANLDYTSGVVNNASAPGTWTGQFCIPARFDTDRMKFRMTPELNVVWEGVPIIELT